MASILSMGSSEESSHHRKFSIHLEWRDKFFILTALLIIVATPYISTNFLNFSPQAVSQNITDGRINEKISLQVGESRGYQLVGIATNDWLTGWAQWTKGGQIDVEKDIKIIVNTPSGQNFVFDDTNPTGSQPVNVFGPLDPGIYTITVTNDGQVKLNGVTIQLALGRKIQ